MPEVLFFFHEERAVKTERRKIRFFFPLEVARYLIDHAKGRYPKAGLQLESGTAGAVVRVLFTSRNLVKSVVNRVTSDT